MTFFVKRLENLSSSLSEPKSQVSVPNSLQESSSPGFKNLISSSAHHNSL